MFGRTANATLELQKQLLIAESEVNRAQLSQEWRKMAHGVHGLADWAKTIAARASLAALLAAGLSTFRHSKVTAAKEKSSWFKRVLKGAQLAGSILLALRGRSRVGARLTLRGKPSWSNELYRAENARG